MPTLSLLICNEALPDDDGWYSLMKVNPILKVNRLPLDIYIFVSAFVGSLKSVEGDNVTVASMIRIEKTGESEVIAQVETQSLIREIYNFTHVVHPILVNLTSTGNYQCVYMFGGQELGRFPFWVELAP